MKMILITAIFTNSYFHLNKVVSYFYFNKVVEKHNLFDFNKRAHSVVPLGLENAWKLSGMGTGVAKLCWKLRFDRPHQNLWFPLSVVAPGHKLLHKTLIQNFKLLFHKSSFFHVFTSTSCQVVIFALRMPGKVSF